MLICTHYYLPVSHAEAHMSFSDDWLYKLITVQDYQAMSLKRFFILFDSLIILFLSQTQRCPWLGENDLTLMVL